MKRTCKEKIFDICKYAKDNHTFKKPTYARKKYSTSGEYAKLCAVIHYCNKNTHFVFVFVWLKNMHFECVRRFRNSNNVVKKYAF